MIYKFYYEAVTFAEVEVKPKKKQNNFKSFVLNCLF